jgi:glycine/D-amino acid oxidase-like deaminating enzyme
VAGRDDVDLTSGYPFWPVNDGLIRAYPRLDHDATCDAVVLGGGITGALVAHHLIEAGIETVVVDKRDVASGSTAATTALLQYEIDTSLTDLSRRYGPQHGAHAYLACRDAVERLTQLITAVPDAVGFERKRSLYLASRRRDHRALRTEWQQRRAIGLGVDWLDESDIRARFSFRRTAALLTPDAAQVDAYALAHALLRRATDRGLMVFDRTTVKAVRHHRRGVTLRTADGWKISARWIIFATGYETEAFLEANVARLVSTYAIVSEPLASFEGWGEDACLIWEHARPYLYLRVTPDGRAIVGGEDEDFRNPIRRDRLIPHKTRRLVKRFQQMFPQLDFEVAFAWAGTFGETADGLAYVGTRPRWPRAYFALGYGGNGITFSMLAAEIIRDALLGRSNPDGMLFRFDR